MTNTTTFSITSSKSTDECINSDIKIDKVDNNIFLAGEKYGNSQSGDALYKYNPKDGDKAVINYKNSEGEYINYITRIHYLFTHQHSQVSSENASVPLTVKYEDLTLEYSQGSSKENRPSFKLSNQSYKFKTSGNENNTKVFYIKNDKNNTSTTETLDFYTNLKINTFIYDQDNKKIIETTPDSIKMSYGGVTVGSNYIKNIPPSSKVDVLISKNGYENFKTQITIPSSSEYVSNDIYYIVLNKNVDVDVVTNLKDDNLEIILTSTGFTQEGSKITVSDNSLVECTVKHGSEQYTATPIQAKSNNNSETSFRFDIKLGNKLKVNALPVGTQVSFNTANLSDFILDEENNEITTFQNTTVPYTCTYNGRTSSYESNITNSDVSVTKKEKVLLNINKIPKDASLYEINTTTGESTIFEGNSKLLDYNSNYKYNVKKTNYISNSNTLNNIVQDTTQNISLDVNYIKKDSSSIIIDKNTGKHTVSVNSPRDIYFIGGNKCINYIPNVGFYCYPLVATSTRTYDSNLNMTKDYSIPKYTESSYGVTVDNSYYFSSNGTTWETKTDFPDSIGKGLTDWGKKGNYTFQVVVPFLSPDNTSSSTSSLYIYVHEKSTWTKLSVTKGCYDYVKVYGNYILLSFRDYSSTKKTHYKLCKISFDNNGIPSLETVKDYSFKNTYGSPVLGCIFKQEEADTYIYIISVAYNKATTNFPTGTLYLTRLYYNSIIETTNLDKREELVENNNTKYLLSYLKSLKSPYYNGFDFDLPIIKDETIGRYKIGPYTVDKLDTDMSVYDYQSLQYPFNKERPLLDSGKYTYWNHRELYNNEKFIMSNRGDYSEDFYDVAYSDVSDNSSLHMFAHNNNTIYGIYTVTSVSNGTIRLSLETLSPKDTSNLS